MRLAVPHILQRLRWYFSASTSRVIVAIACLCLFIVSFTWRQEIYPAPWFDEGLNLSTAAMIADYGLYALPDADGARLMDPAIQTGPTVILPIAAVFRFFGTGLTQARSVLLVMSLVTAILYFVVSTRLVGVAASILAVVFLLVGSHERFASFLFMGRQSLGEVPALGLYLLGMLIWWRTLGVRRPWPLRIASGLVWGLAMITKSQVLLFVPVILVVMSALDHMYYRQAKFVAYLVPLVVAVAIVGAWYLVQALTVGVDQFQQNSAVLREGFGLHIAGLNPAHWKNALSVIWHSGWWMWGPVSLVWGLAQARHNTNHGFRHAFALLLPVCALFWFVLFSVGWGRYAFYAFSLTPIWLAGLLMTVWRSSIRIPSAGALKGAVSCIIAIFVIGNAGATFSDLFWTSDPGFSEMQRFLDRSYPSDLIIDTWEWEFGIDADRQFRHPTTHVANLYTSWLYGDGSQPVNSWLVGSSYILLGPFGRWTGIYDSQIRDVEIIFESRNYVLYEVD